MTIENTPTPEQTQNAIEKETQRILDSNAAKHGIDPKSFTIAQVEDARNTARQTVERQQALEKNPLWIQLEQERKRNLELEAQIAAVRAGAHPMQRQGQGPKESSYSPSAADAARAKLGDEVWLHTLSESGRFNAAGIDPASAGPDTRELSRRVFGRGADSALASDLMKVNPARYRLLKEVAKIIGVYGN